jgi:Tfp pilus assembly PilM family ATPase
MAQLIEKIKNFFTVHPCPPVVFQLSSSYISGISIAVKERKVKHHAILPLPAGLIEPHFDRKNLADATTLAGLIKEGLKGLHFSGERAACLIPESCLKIFVLSFESFPPSERERARLLRWRVKKQMPVLPEDARLSYEVIASSASMKVLASLARTAVLQEYEDLFGSLGLKVGVLTVPTLSLLNLVDWEGEKDFIVANFEEDSISLAAITQSEMTLYRFKPFVIERQTRIQAGQNIETVIKEIENTVHFIEDREKREIHSLWLSSSLAENQAEVISQLARRLPFSIKPIESPYLSEIPPSERATLAPLAGQII